jgi:hypothetical protein
MVGTRRGRCAPVVGLAAASTTDYLLGSAVDKRSRKVGVEIRESVAFSDSLGLSGPAHFGCPCRSGIFDNKWPRPCFPFVPIKPVT